MKYSLAAELLLASSATAVLHVPVAKRDRHNNGETADVARGLVRRAAGTLDTTLFSGVGFVSGGAYYANISVGTPAQQQTVLLDTGSSDLYFDARSAPACQSSGPHQCLGSTFSPGSSSSYKQVLPSPSFNASYGDGSMAIGPFGQDRVCINNICIDGVQFGVAEDVHSTVGPAIGLMGVGSSFIEATRHQYPNIPDTLVEAGVINSRLYSLYLNDYDAVTGSILFGGIDTDKYTGTLQTTDTLPDPVTGFVDQFITTVTDMKTTVNGKSATIWSNGLPGAQAYKSTSPSLPVLLDSGSSAWSVPQNYFSKIVQQFDYVDPQTGVTSCKYADGDDSVTLTFNAQVDVTVGIAEFLLPLYDTQTGKPETLSNGDAACGFEIIPSPGTGEGFETMGDAVIRSMYIVYDLDQGQMSIAQAKLNSTSSSVKVVQAGPGGVAKAAGSSGKNAPSSQSYSIAPSVSANASFSLSTAKSAIGTATGEAAVPTAARVSMSSSSGGGGGGSGNGKSAASTIAIHSSSWIAFYTVGAAALLAVLGASLMM